MVSNPKKTQRKIKYNRAQKQLGDFINRYYKEYIRVNTYQEFKKKKACEVCNHKSNNLEFHHISYLPNIFITICSKCHKHGNKTKKKDIIKSLVDALKRKNQTSA